MPSIEPKRRVMKSSTSFPEADPDALATAVWTLVHGLAFLHLDGKLDSSTPTVVADHVTAAIHALLTAVGTP
jgi:hypothetical protein